MRSPEPDAPLRRAERLLPDAESMVLVVVSVLRVVVVVSVLRLPLLSEPEVPLGLLAEPDMPEPEPVLAEPEVPEPVPEDPVVLDGLLVLAAPLPLVPRLFGPLPLGAVCVFVVGPGVSFAEAGFEFLPVSPTLLPDVDPDAPGEVLVWA